MNRRKLLISLPLLIGGAVISWPAYKFIRWKTSPNLTYLKNQHNMLAAIADTFIPKTDSPSASECGVHEFIIRTVAECSDIITQNKFIDGLQYLIEYTNATYGTSFESCPPDIREKVLTHIAVTDRPWQGVPGKVQKKYLGIPFFTTLKNYTIYGYCTSEGGATQALRYVAVPGHYAPCAPYATGDRAWATT